MSHIHIDISPEVEAILPGTFIQYLCGLAEAAAREHDGAQAFVLRAQAAGMDDLQEVIHYTEQMPTGERYYAYGFEPVDAALCVRRQSGRAFSLTYTQTNAAVAV